jgi:hypothetical protein
MIPQEDDMDDYYTKKKYSLTNHRNVLITLMHLQINRTISLIHSSYL